MLTELTLSIKGLLWNLKSPKGRLPDFLIIGALKCGTSTISAYLKAHPQINLVEKEGGEFHFFDTQRYQYGKSYYQSHFTELTKIQGEKTPRYIFDQSCHIKMAKVVPQAKLILILRDPVYRAYSHWNHFNFDPTKKNWIARTFEDALKLKPQILERGHYIDQIEHLLRFYQREQLHIIILEHFLQDIQKGSAQLFNFLELPPHSLATSYQANARTYQTTMQSETQASLKTYYANYNQRLFNFLGHSIKEWL